MLALALLLIAAAPETTPESVTVEPVTVVGEKPSPLLKPQSEDVLDREAIHRNEGVFLDDSINLLPGVRLESRTVSGGQRITIRGYGNATNFNGTGYKAYLNGIPITDAEGTTVLDDVDVSTLGRIDVIKGPASSLYGSGIGGTVQLSTMRPDLGTRLTQEVLGGNYGLVRTNTRLETANETSSLLVNYGYQRSDGYRVHSAGDKDFVLLAGDYRPNSRQTLTYTAQFNHSFEQLAGQLTEDQFFARQNVAEVPYVQNNGHVAIDSLRLGIAHRYDFLDNFSNTTIAFGDGYQLNQPFAVGLSDNMALTFGGRTEFNARFGPVLATLGGELEQTNAFKKSYGLTNAVQGAIRGDLQLRALTSNAFAQAMVALPGEITAVAGASLNFVRYDIKDRVVATGHVDQSGLKSFDPVITPRIALQKAWNSAVTLFADVSTGYTAPASSAVVISQIGQVNQALRPEYGTQYELGSKGSVLDNRLYYEASLFWLHVSDKLTTQAVTGPTGSTLYTTTVNAGAQDNRGVELAARYAVVPQLLSAFASYTYSNFRYDGFGDFTGKKVAGVPEHMINLGVDVTTRLGLYGNATFQHLSGMPLTFDNAHWAPQYSLLDAKVGYRRDLPAGFRMDVSLGGRNLTNSTYYTMAFLNASYAGAQPNVYLPGPGVTVYGGLTLSKSL